MSKTRISTSVVMSKKGQGLFEIYVDTIRKCPYCGTATSPIPLSSSALEYGSEMVLTVVLTSRCCDKPFISLYLCKDLFDKTVETKSEYLCTYPNIQTKKLPEPFYELSPRFIDLYNQSHTAEQNNHIELAATGYRNSLEILIKDYAIKKLGKPHDDVVKKSLFQSIRDYMPSGLLSNGADVIRLLGNDYTHYERKYPEHDFFVLKNFTEAFISVMNYHLTLNDPPAGLPIQSKS